MALPLRFCYSFLLTGQFSHQKIRLAKFSVSPIKAKRKVSGGKFFNKFGAAMSVPRHKLFVWQHHDGAQTSCSSKTNEQFLQFALGVSSTDGTKSQTVFLKRPYSEPFSGFRGRLRQRVKGFLKEFDDGELPIQAIYSDGHSSAVDDDVNLFQLFYNSDQQKRLCTTLEIAKAKYAIVRDPAWLDKVEIALLPLVGCPIFPSCDWKYATDNVRFLWFVASEKLPLRINRVEEQCFADRAHLDPAEWQHVHTGPFYSPTMDHIGKFLAVIVDFDDDGIAVGTVCPTPINKLGGTKNATNQHEEEEEELIFERRQKECCARQLSGDRYRLISYNILASLYLNLRVEQKDLFFPYCPKPFLEQNYRFPLILRELEGYNADLMFLQEVDFRMQKRFLIPFLHLKNYSTFFNCKENEVNEGLVIAFRNDRFHSVAQEAHNLTVKLSTFLADDPTNSDIREYLQHRNKLRTIVTTRPTILQLVRLRSKHAGRDVLCANTHLYFDPAHEEVKIIQTLLCLRYIDKIRSHLPESDATQLLFAGDLNSLPDSDAVKLIGGAEIQLKMPRDVPFDGNDGVDSMRIRAPFKSQLLSGSPDYTNFTKAEGFDKGFKGCLDYIWAHPPLHIEHIWPMPDNALVTKYGAIPSAIAPSDHLPLLCDVQLTSGSVEDQQQNNAEGVEEEAKDDSQRQREKC